jgi:hypothetical protein
MVIQHSLADHRNRTARRNMSMGKAQFNNIMHLDVRLKIKTSAVRGGRPCRRARDTVLHRHPCSLNISFE